MMNTNNMDDKEVQELTRAVLAKGHNYKKILQEEGVEQLC